MEFIKPKIIISKCLEFDACRYDGQIINNKYIKILKKYIDFKHICPEVEIGMDIPRDAIRLIKNKNDLEKKLYQPKTKKYFTTKMNSFSKKYLEQINTIDGFILKSDSPSCGINTAKIYPKTGNVAAEGRESGLFASHILSMFPDHPKEEEKRLNNVFIREHFYTSIFSIADFRKVETVDSLYKYHAKHKYLFMSYNQLLMRKMGQIAASANKKNIKCTITKYHKVLLKLFRRKSRIPSNINTHMHVMGYFKKMLSHKEKMHFLDILEQYRNKQIPISSVNSILLSWINRFGNKYLEKQSFFEPFPKELINKNKSRFL
tara:strand:+ start:684 stop:1637 length:954 start_codon:yes stop_codon:yes gene_type:complete